MIYTQENVQMDHTCLKDLTSLYHTHQCLAPSPLALSQQWICRRPYYFCLGHLQCLSEYNFTQTCINSLSKCTISLYGLVKNKMTKTSSRLNKSEGIIHSGNKIHPRNKTFWIILLWHTKINIHHCKIIRSSSYHAIFSWVYKITNKYLLLKKMTYHWQHII